MRPVSFLLDLLFPPRCAFCGAILERAGDGVCPACLAALPLRADGDAVRTVGERGYPCAVALYYDGPVKAGVHALKFEGKSWRAAVFGRYVAQAAAEHLAGSFDAVTYVPVSPLRRFTRGYDQARLLAQAAAAVWDRRAERTVKKVRHNRAQSSLSAPGLRRENVKGVYRAVRPSQVEGRRFLLIDDVCTTGSTIAACADALMDAGAASVVCAALAGGHGERTGE